MYAPGSPFACKFFGMDRFNVARVSISAFSSKIACGSFTSAPMVFVVLLKRYAKRFVFADAADFKTFVATFPASNFFAALKAEVVAELACAPAEFSDARRNA